MSDFDSGDRNSGLPRRSTSSRSSRRSAQGSSYTDRFRADAPFAQPSATLAASGGSSGRNRTQNPEISIGQILALVDRATAPSSQLDLSLNLQIADLVNEKKGNAPREVAMKLASLANSRFVATALAALSVLDVCVKNCGYPFHLAISRRDFLNLLVRKFPERPPLKYTRVQTLILEMIEEWNATLVKTSRYRDDLGFIRDMHRLLTYKGYIFPEVSAEEIAALTPEQDTLKSAAELEREDREAQSAKLQELIRSGTPQDLKEANRLMSIMAGFRETRIDYHAKVAAELEKVRRKADILTEMLQQATDSGTLPKGGADDVFTELAQSLKTALPKIRSILNDEESLEDDEEAKVKIESLRETVEAVLEKYNKLVSGDPGANDVSIPGSSSSAAVQSLIDIEFDDNNTATPPPSSGSSSKSPQDDLLGLSFGALSLGPTPSQPSAPSSTADILQLSASTPTPPLVNDAPKQGASQDSDPFALFSSSNEDTNNAVSSSAKAGDSQAEKPLWSDETITIAYTAQKSEDTTDLVLIFSNPSRKKITNLEVQLAAPKSLNMEISPLSSTSLESGLSAGIRQRVILKGITKPKLRWRINYNWGLDVRTATGDLKNI